MDPGQGRELDILDGLPRLAFACWSADKFGLVIAVHGLSERVVIRIPDGPDRGNRADLGEALAVAQRRKLRPGVAWPMGPRRRLCRSRSGESLSWSERRSGSPGRCSELLYERDLRQPPVKVARARLFVFLPYRYDSQSRWTDTSSIEDLHWDSAGVHQWSTLGPFHSAPVG